MAKITHCNHRQILTTMGSNNSKISPASTILMILLAAVASIGGFYLVTGSGLLQGGGEYPLGLSPQTIHYLVMGASGAFFLLLLVQAIRLHLQLGRLRRELNSAQRQSSATDHSNQELLQHVSHKIRTPLSTLTASLEMLKSSDVLEYQVDPINIMDSSLDAINVLVNDVVDTISLEGYGIRLTHELVTLNEFLESLYIGIRPLAQANGLLLNFDWPKHESIGIDTDSLRLRQVVYNVLYNLIGFNDKGVVSLQIESTYGEREVVQLRFRFTGASIGMNDAQLEDFRKFVSNQSEANPGRPACLDIGLFNGTIIVRQMGGHIDLSRTGDGDVCLTIGIAFPLYYSTRHGGSTEVEGDMDQPQSGGSAAFSRLCRTLIVDDIPVNRIMMKKVIDKLGIICDQAGSGLEALQKVQQASYELVLLDISMPDIDGIEVTRRIRSMNLNKQPVIIAVTATAVDSMRRDAEQAGIESVITKPFKLEELKNVLSGFFDLEQAGKPRLKLR